MRKVFYILCFALLTFCQNSDDIPLLDTSRVPGRTNDFSLWQVEQYKGESQMGYIIRTDSDKIIVIDGGIAETSRLLKVYIDQLGGVVHTWIVTHPHKDHMGALNHLLTEKSVTIRKIIHSKLDLDLIERHEPSSYALAKEFYQNMDLSKIPVIDSKVGEEIVLGQGVVMKVLSDKTPGILKNLVNNGSLVFQVKSNSKTVLFTGDLGEEGGLAVLKNNDLETLQSTHVQMAHHGQDGVSKEFYAAVGAKIALWPTPRWLWENNLDAKGFNTGTWETLIVKGWMDDLKIEQNIVAGLEGTSKID